MLGTLTSQVWESASGLLGMLGLERGLAYQPWVRERVERALHDVSQSMLPEGGAIPYSAEDTGVVEYLLERFDELPPDKRDLIAVTMLMYEFVFPVFFRRGLRFSKMDAGAQEQMMRDLEFTDVYIFRMLSTMIRVFVCMAYLADERVLHEMEYFKMNAYESDPRDIELRPGFSQWSEETPEAAVVTEEKQDPAQVERAA
ncbi:MAG: hypothetical protein H6728_07650 [Myxococcales bacterium]|nr:hypothetical protein [Myxococcales bacterium]MCB9642936.1 hypothetical protein [Myxococcales bacterium]